MRSKSAYLVQRDGDQLSPGLIVEICRIACGTLASAWPRLHDPAQGCSMPVEVERGRMTLDDPRDELA
jgi:hypothetical protein